MKKEPTKKTDEEVKESKANAKKATKAANKKAMKAASDKLLVTMAADMPGANASKSFLDLNGQLDKIELEAAKLNLAKRGVRGELRKMKVDLSALDRVRKLRKMEPEDVVAKKATEALYEEQLSMPLSDEQKAILKALNAKREENKKAILAASGGHTGKEVGTGAANRVPERADVAESERVEDNQSKHEQVVDPYAHAAGVHRY
jgi:hypothetical protein